MVLVIEQHKGSGGSDKKGDDKADGDGAERYSGRCSAADGDGDPLPSRNRSPPLCLPKVPPSARSSYGPPALFKMISLFRFLLLIFLAATKRSV